MSTADQLSVLSAKVGCTAVCLADGGLVQGWMKSRRILCVMRDSIGMLHAVAVFSSTSFPVVKDAEVNLEIVVPINLEFRCEIDAGADSVIVKLITGGGSGSPLMFEMLPGFHTQNFVSELFRLQEEVKVKLKEGVSYDFRWIENKIEASTDNQKKDTDVLDFDPLSISEKKGSEKDQDNPLSGATDSALASAQEPEDSSDSPESSLNRQEIAMGVSPIAARESVVKYQMALKEDQFTRIQTFTVFIGTWNVNGQSPKGAVREWLSPDQDPPDLYAIGFQELDLSKEAFVFNESPKEDEWQATVFASLHPKAKYKKVKLIRLVGMMLIVYVKSQHAPYIKDVAAETVGTGIMGKLGNKGGVAVRFDFHNTSICMVNSHLAAHQSECERRNQDYHDICTRMQFQQFIPPKAIKDHDMIYWLGDLNYRINDFDTNAVKELLKKNNLAAVLEKDQFEQQKRLRKAFPGYLEGDITFIPTYKFDMGTNDWDSSEKGRAPAWTDRVLWKGDHIQQTVYRSHMELKVSDHKPVSAVFKSGMKVVDPVKYRRIYEDVMKKLDRLENEFLPQVTVDTTEINFDKIKFFEPNTKTLTVANTGQVPVQFEFIKKLNDKSICKPWLSVEPSLGFIMPGDKSDIALEIYVDKKTAGPLTCGQDQMYDILVLHLVGGKDIFITVSGDYQKSSFGASINALCQMTVPICELSIGKLMDLEGMGKSDSTDKGKPNEEPYPVPKELWFLCDLITSLGLGTENLFLQPGLRAETIAIRDWLDTGLPVATPVVSIHSAAEALLLFLESLREPIVPFNAYNSCLEASPNYLQCKQIVAQLPAHHKNVFNYMTSFLREVIRYSTKNGIDPKILATLFSGIFLRDPPGLNLGSGIKAKTQQVLLDQKKARFVYHFIVNEGDD